MKIKRKIRKISAFFFFASLILIVFLIYPAIKSIKNGSAEIISIKNEASLIMLQSEKMENFREKHKNYEDDFQKISQLFVDSQNPIEFIKFLEESARSSGTNIDVNLISSADGKQENEQRIVFQINAMGSFLSVLKFYEKLESGPYLASIQSSTIKKSEQLADENNNYSQPGVEASFTIEAVVSSR